MNTFSNITLHGYTVEYIDLRALRPRTLCTETVVFSGDMVKAAQELGQDLTEIIRQRYARQGYNVLTVTKAGRCAVQLDLAQLWAQQAEQASKQQGGAE